MPIGTNICGWRRSRGLSLAALAAQTGLDATHLEAIESGETDPSVSTLDAIASALRVPPSWLYGHPKQLELLTTDSDGEVVASPGEGAIDPVLEQVLEATRQRRDLYVLLTAVLQSGDPKLLLAAEASLKSLAKQARQASVPWQSRPSGHFEPPSD